MAYNEQQRYPQYYFSWEDEEGQTIQKEPSSLSFSNHGRFEGRVFLTTTPIQYVKKNGTYIIWPCMYNYILVQQMNQKN